jgi:hypothetical protein
MIRTLNLAAVFALTALFAVNASAQNMVGPGQPHNELNKKVVQFCLSNEGKTIDRGECWDVAAAALKYADAKHAVDFDFGQKYDWRSQQILPGDIIQFGISKLESSGQITQHTAVVLENQGNKKLKVAHQNVGGKRFIVFEVMDFNTATGQIDFSHPVLPQGASPRPAATTTTPTTPAMQPKKQDAAKAGFPEGYFQLTTKSGENQKLVLESAPLMLQPNGDFTGMRWKATPIENMDGCFYLTSQFLAEKNQVLESSDGKNPAVMVPNEKYSGTMWKVLPAGDGYFYLTTLPMESQNKVLNGNVGKDAGVSAVFQGTPYMVDKDSAGPGALWKFIPLPRE